MIRKIFNAKQKFPIFKNKQKNKKIKKKMIRIETKLIIENREKREFVKLFLRILSYYVLFNFLGIQVSTPIIYLHVFFFRFVEYLSISEENDHVFETINESFLNTVKMLIFLICLESEFFFSTFSIIKLSGYDYEFALKIALQVVKMVFISFLLILVGNISGSNFKEMIKNDAKKQE